MACRKKYWNIGGWFLEGGVAKREMSVLSEGSKKRSREGKLSSEKKKVTEKNWGGERLRRK